MRYSRAFLGIIGLCLMSVVLLTGCAKKVPVVVPPADSSTEATSSSEATAEAETAPSDTPTTQTGGPITTPITGTLARTQLMDAARKKLGTKSQFVVYQLYVQGDQAIGDLEEPSGGSRQFVLFKGPEWEAVWVAPFGSASASSAGAKSGVPGFSDELLSKIDWKFSKPVSDAAMLSSLTAAAKKWSKTLMEGLGQPYVVASAKVAQDASGTWWGRVVIHPTASATSSFEPIDFWCTYSAGAWTGKAQDPEPPPPTSYFPASVAGALGF